MVTPVPKVVIAPSSKRRYFSRCRTANRGCARRSVSQLLGSSTLRTLRGGPQAGSACGMPKAGDLLINRLRWMLFEDVVHSVYMPVSNVNGFCAMSVGRPPQLEARNVP